jgi:hypothetical protein
MMLEKKIGGMSPVFLRRFESLVLDNSNYGKGSSKDQYVTSKFFASAYEFYLYAYFIGVAHSYRLEIDEDDDTIKFWEIENWRPKEIANCLIASALGETNLDLIAMEHMEENGINKEIRKVRNTIEAFANGGFELIEGFVRENPESVGDDRFFINLIAKKG